METNLTDVLDNAGRRLIAGESFSAILADYPAHADTLYPLLKSAATLDTLRPVSMPATEAMRADRDAFLAKIVAMQPAPVSLTLVERLKGWIDHYLPTVSFNSMYPRREQWRMNTLMIKALVILGIVFGSAGGTAAYASQSLPGSPVYPLKLAIEQTQMALVDDPAEQAQLQLTLAQVRMQEMEQLAQQGEVPNDATMNRLQNHINQAFQLVAQLPDDQMRGLLTQTQTQLQSQEQHMAQIQNQLQDPIAEPLRQAYRLVNQARNEAQLGLEDPAAFRWRHQNGAGNPETPGGPCQNPDCKPQGEQQQNGPADPNGPCESPDCAPQGDQQQQQQQQNQLQNQNQHKNEPQEPAGPCDGLDCEPQRDQQQDQQRNQIHDQLPAPTTEPCNTDDCQPQNQERQQNQTQNQNQNQNTVQPEPEPQPNPLPEPPSPDQGDNSQNASNGDGNDSGNSSSGGNDNGGNDSSGNDSSGNDSSGSNDGGSDNSGSSSGGNDNGGSNGGGKK